MNMEERAIEIIKEGTITSKAPVTIHITYNESLTLKEFSDVLDLINKAINDVNREYGMAILERFCSRGRACDQQSTLVEGL